MYIFATIVIVLLTVKIVTEFRKPFRFESFDTSEGLLSYLESNIPTKSKASYFIGELIQSGAKCEAVKNEYFPKELPKDCSEIVFCKYNTGWFSYPPLIEYTVTVYIDKEAKVVSYSAGRFYGGL